MPLTGSALSALSAASALATTDLFYVDQSTSPVKATLQQVLATALKGFPTRLTADVTNATNTFANLGDLSMTLLAGVKYTGRMVVKCNNSTAAEGIKFDFGGGAATMTSFWAAGGQPVGGVTVLGTVIGTSLTGALTWTTITGETIIVVDISLVVNAGGTFIPRFAEGVAHTLGTATAELGSFLQLTASTN